MTTAEARRQRSRISIALGVVNLVVLLIVLVLALIRNHELGDATDANRATICAAARIIELNPVRQFPDESAAHYKKRLVAAGIFLRLAAKIDCDTVLAIYGIRAPTVTSTTVPRGGDALRPPAGSQLHRAAAGGRPRRPAGPRLARVLNPARPAPRGRRGRPVSPVRVR